MNSIVFTESMALLSSKISSYIRSLYYMKVRFKRNRTSIVIVMYSLYLYFLGLSLRNTCKVLVIFRDENRRSYVSVWNWIQRFGSFQIYKRKRVSAFIIDETVIQIGNQHFCLRICIEPIHISVLGTYISEKRNMLIAEKFIKSLVSKYRSILYTQMEVHGMMKQVRY